MGLLQEFLEKDKEKLLRDLAEAGTADKAETVLTKECDRLLLMYGQAAGGGSRTGSSTEDGGSEEAVRTAGELLEAVKLTIPLTDSIGETKIYERRETKEEKKAGKLPKTIFLILLSAGIVLAILSVVLLALSAPREKLELSGMLRTIGMLSASLICLLCAGLTLSKLYAPTGADRERKIENIVDAEKLYRTLRAAVIAIDRDLADHAAGRAARMRHSENGDSAASAAAGIGDRELGLYGDLLAAAAYRDGDAALECIEDLKYYLHTRGIEAVAYSEETKRYFEMMPSTAGGTIRPALVKDGELLMKGLAGGTAAGPRS